MKLKYKERKFKWYSIMNVTGGGIFDDIPPTRGLTSRCALESFLMKKVRYLKSDFDLKQVSKNVYSVIEGDETGRIYRE